MTCEIFRNLGRVSGGVILNVAVLILPALAVGRILDLATDLVAILFFVLATLFAGVELWLTRDHNEHLEPLGRFDDQRARRLAMLSGVLLLLLFWGCVWQRTLTHQAPTIVRQVTGAMLMLTGILLRGAAIAYLGHEFRTEVYRGHDRCLVRSGIYGWIRHPSEIGLLAIAAGACLLTGWTEGLAIGLCGLVPISLLRVRLEDRCLETAHGKQFLKYKRQVSSFVPWIG